MEESLHLFNEIKISNNIYSPRIRTGLLRIKGGLNKNEQCVRIGIMLPERKEDGEILRSKLYIASGMFEDGKENEKPKEYISLRMGELMDINSFSVSFFLAVREFCRYENLNQDYVYTGLMKRLMAVFKTSNFDAQIHSYGSSKYQ
jgi:hypothetical protein